MALMVAATAKQIAMARQTVNSESRILHPPSPPVGHFDEIRFMCRSAGCLGQSNALSGVVARALRGPLRYPVSPPVAGRARMTRRNCRLSMREVRAPRRHAAEGCSAPRIRTQLYLECYCACRRHQGCHCVWKRRLRYVCVFWAALGQAVACLYLMRWDVGRKAQGLDEKLNAEHLLSVSASSPIGERWR